MPIWTCPKCEKNEVYEGTVIQQKSSGAVGFIGEQAGESSISPIIHRPLGSKSVEVTVTKCKHCDIILGEKDKVYTHAELAAAQERKDQQIENIPILFCFAAGAYGIFTLLLILDSNFKHEEIFGFTMLVPSILQLTGIWKSSLGKIKPSTVCTVAALLQIPTGILGYMLASGQPRASDDPTVFAVFSVAVGFVFFVLGKFYSKTGR